ncbi:unnamed protein product [Hermetia illucens]|uniref:Uncharacterized protein n=1 Tax=Hermetia illucens TaxID=343691 RepID=A0A7R8YRL1_HERIL|nr:unnamed protein product [Hermetia illucens]
MKIAVLTIICLFGTLGSCDVLLENVAPGYHPPGFHAQYDVPVLVSSPIETILYPWLDDNRHGPGFISSSTYGQNAIW